MLKIHIGPRKIVTALKEASSVSDQHQVRFFSSSKANFTQEVRLFLRKKKPDKKCLCPIVFQKGTSTVVIFCQVRQVFILINFNQSSRFQSKSRISLFEGVGTRSQPPFLTSSMVRRLITRLSELTKNLVQNEPTG